MLERTTTGYTALVGGLLRKVAIGGAIFIAMLVAVYLGVTSIPTGFVPPEDEGYFQSFTGRIFSDDSDEMIFWNSILPVGQRLP